MNFSEAAAARDRLEPLGEAYRQIDPILADQIATVCAWTRHWEHACAELDAVLANEKAHARNYKIPAPGDDR